MQNDIPKAPMAETAEMPAPAPLNEDEETAKRRARAERFGIPFKDAPTPAQKKSKTAGAVNGGGQKEAVRKEGSGAPLDVSLRGFRIASFGVDPHRS